MRDLDRLGVRFEAVSFPERLEEALGRPEPLGPELNPVPQLETVRYVNGLPRQAEVPTWFEAPAQTEELSPVRHGQLMAGLARKLSLRGDLDPAAAKLRDLLKERAERLASIQRARRGGEAPRRLS